MKVDPIEEIKLCRAGFIKGYLEWRVAFSRIKKQSSITTYWKVHSMLYMEEAKRYMDDDMLLDIRNVGVRRPSHARVTNYVVVDPGVLDTDIQA
jgi:hypothetical protein